MNETTRDLICGTIGGISGKIVEYPLDTVKVRMQISEEARVSAWSVTKYITRNEGIMGFYAGIMAPIYGAAFENAASFLGYGFATSWFRKHVMNIADDRDTNILLPIHGVFMCGAFSGIAAGTVLCPWELLKCRVQESQLMKGLGQTPPYNGILDCAIKTIRNEGAFSLFNGWAATLLREIPGNAAWFGCYELSLRTFFIPENGTRDDCAWYAFPMSGGIGGIGLWSVGYPFDTIKTRIQTDPEYLKLGVRKGLATLYRHGGIQALYRGFGVTLLRAFPANATIFAIYELSAKVLKGSTL